MTVAYIWGVAPQFPNTKLTIRQFSETGVVLADYPNIVRQDTGGDPFLLCKNGVTVVSDAATFFTVKNNVVSSYVHTANLSGFYFDNQYAQYADGKFRFTIVKRDTHQYNIYDIQYWTSPDGLNWTKEFSSRDSSGSPGTAMSHIFYSTAQRCYYSILGEYGSSGQTPSYLYKSVDLATWTLQASAGYPRVALPGPSCFWDIGDYVYHLAYGLNGIDYIARRTPAGLEEAFYLDAPNCLETEVRLNNYMYFFPTGELFTPLYNSIKCDGGGFIYDSFGSDSSYTVFEPRTGYNYASFGYPGDRIANCLRVPCVLSDGVSAIVYGNRMGNAVVRRADETYFFIPGLSTYSWYSIAFDGDERLMIPGPPYYDEFWTEEVKCAEQELQFE